MINTLKAPQPIGCYSQAFRAGNLVFLSGQIGLDPQTGELVSAEFEKQLQQVFNNMKEVVIAAGGSFKDIVKLTVFLKDLKDFPRLNEVMQLHFSKPYPARSAIEASNLPKGALIEIEAIVAL